MVVALKTLNEISRIAAPFIYFAVRGHCVNKMRSAILNGDGISMRVPPTCELAVVARFLSGYQHVSESVYAVGVVFNSLSFNDTKSVQLPTKRSFANYKLSCVCTI